MAVAMGFFFGRWLDKKLDTEPWLMITFVVLGAAAGFRELYRIARRAAEPKDKDENKPGGSDA